MTEYAQTTNMNPDNSNHYLQAEKPVKIQDISLRDGHQSLFASRGRTQDMVRIAEQMDDIGFWACEVWGGSTFAAMHQFLGEDPWERLRTLKRYMQKTPLSMLLRGQNLVGDRNYADDVAKLFVKKSAENGLEIFRIFDALNDYRNFEVLVPVIKNCGAHFQGCICYSTTKNGLECPIYDLEYYVNKARELEKMGADSICIKDSAGLLRPYDAYKLVTKLKASVSVMIHLNSHFTSGMAPMTHIKAIEAGVDIVDTCLSPYAYNTSHPAIEPLVITLSGTKRETGFDIQAFDRINTILNKEVIPKYTHFMEKKPNYTINSEVLIHQIPSYMLRDIVDQLLEMDALDKIDQVHAEIPRVRKELGQIPLVTPTSKIVETQAINNVLFDTKEERYKMITTQVRDLCYGLYGKTPAPIDKDLQKKALEGYERGENPINCRPGQILEAELETAREKIGDLATNDEDLLTYTLFPITGKKFLLQKYGKEPVPESLMPITLEEVEKQNEIIKKALSGELIEKIVPEKSPFTRTFNVFVEGENFEVCVDEIGGTTMMRTPTQIQTPITLPAQTPQAPPEYEMPKPVTPKKSSAPAPIKSVPSHAKTSDSKKSSTNTDTEIKAPMPGTIIRYEKTIGDSVKAGETVVIIEAMKMENSLPAPVSGELTAINFKNGDPVTKDSVLAIIQNS